MIAYLKRLNIISNHFVLQVFSTSVASHQCPVQLCQTKAFCISFSPLLYVSGTAACAHTTQGRHASHLLTTLQMCRWPGHSGAPCLVGDCRPDLSSHQCAQELASMIHLLRPASCSKTGRSLMPDLSSHWQRYGNSLTHLLSATTIGHKYWPVCWCQLRLRGERSAWCC